MDRMLVDLTASAWAATYDNLKSNSEHSRAQVIHDIHREDWYLKLRGRDLRHMVRASYFDTVPILEQLGVLRHVFVLLPDVP